MSLIYIFCLVPQKLLTSTWQKMHIGHGFFKSEKTGERGRKSNVKERDMSYKKLEVSYHLLEVGFKFGSEILKGQYKTKENTCVQSFGTLGD